jgi:hypothetical protein
MLINRYAKFIKVPSPKPSEINCSQNNNQNNNLLYYQGSFSKAWCPSLGDGNAKKLKAGGTTRINKMSGIGEMELEFLGGISFPGLTQEKFFVPSQRKRVMRKIKVKDLLKKVRRGNLSIN